jgi:hypothetical protein
VDYVLRFLAGGLIVSAFAIVGDVLRPKSFALATLTLAIFKQGPDYVATEGHSMVLGAAAFLLYGFVVCQLLMRFRTSALVATSFALTVWLAAAFGLKQLVIG